MNLFACNRTPGYRPHRALVCCVRTDWSGHCVQLTGRSQYQDFCGGWGAEEGTGADMQEGVGDWRKLHNEELHDMYCSVSVIRVIRAGKMRLVGHVARTEEK